MPTYEATIETDEELGQFIDTSLEQFIGGEETNVSVSVEEVSD